MTIAGVLALLAALAPVVLALAEAWNGRAPERKAKRRRKALEAIDEAIAHLDDPLAVESRLHELFEQVKQDRLTRKP